MQKNKKKLLHKKEQIEASVKDHEESKLLKDKAQDAKLAKKLSKDVEKQKKAEDVAREKQIKRAQNDAEAQSKMASAGSNYVVPERPTAAKPAKATMPSLEAPVPLDEDDGDMEPTEDTNAGKFNQPSADEHQIIHVVQAPKHSAEPKKAVAKKEEPNPAQGPAIKTQILTERKELDRFTTAPQLLVQGAEDIHTEDFQLPKQVPVSKTEIKVEQPKQEPKKEEMKPQEHKDAAKPEQKAESKKAEQKLAPASHSLLQLEKYVY